MNDVKKNDVSIIVPALNEELNLRGAVDNIIKELKGINYEILIFNDGSTDRTGNIAEEISILDSRIKVIHHKTPQNLGSCFREGVELATGEYAIMIPGDDEVDSQTIHNLFSEIGRADIITTYTVNTNIRSIKRRFISFVYTALINGLFNLRLKYFNGPSLIKVDLLRKLPPISQGFAYMSEILVRLIKSGYSYRETEMFIKLLPGRKSRAFGLNNFKQIYLAIVRLFIDVYFKKRLIL